MALISIAVTGFLLVAPWPFWRLAVSTPVRHRRSDQALMLAALGAYGTAIVVAAILWPELVAVAATGVAVVVGALWWRSRPNHRARESVPPGRLRVHPLDMFHDVDHLRREAERYGPIFKIGTTFPIPTMTPMICVVGHDLGLELLRDHERSLQVYPPVPASRFIPRGFLRNMTNEDHDRYAPIFRHAHSRSVDEAFEAAAAVSATRALERMRADSAAAGDHGIEPGPYLRAFTFEVLARLHFGAEPGSPEHEELAAAYRALDVVGIARWRPQRSRQLRWASLVERIAARADAGDAPAASPNVLREALRMADAGGSLDRETIIGNVLQVQESGTQDLSALLVWVVKHLGDHPAWIERVRAEPAAPNGGSRTLGERIIRETLRLEQSEFLNRRTIEDLDFHGYRFPKGWLVRICIREGHRSPAVFERPTAFDPDRWLARIHPPTEYAPFGLHRHHCLAARLTQRVGAILIEALAAGYRLSITADGPREHGRFHWQPSRRLRVRLDPR